MNKSLELDAQLLTLKRLKNVSLKKEQKSQGLLDLHSERGEPLPTLQRMMGEKTASDCLQSCVHKIL